MSVIATAGAVPAATLDDYLLFGTTHAKLVGEAGIYLLKQTSAFPTVPFSAPQTIASSGVVPAATLDDYLLVATTHGKLLGGLGTYELKQVVFVTASAPPGLAGASGADGAAGTVSRWNALRGVFE